MVGNAVVDRLTFPPGCNDVVFAQQSQMLRQSRLRQSNTRLDFANLHFAIGKLAQHHQPFFITEQAKQRRCAASTFLKHAEVKTSYMNHKLFIFYYSNLANANIHQ